MSKIAQWRISGPKARVWLLLGLLSLVAPLLFTHSASAKVVYKWVYNGTYPAGSFDDSGAVGDGGAVWTGGRVQKLDIDQESGSVYASYNYYPAFNDAEQLIYKFDLAGNAQQFSALAPNTVLDDTESTGEFAVDNSGTATQGRIYVVQNEVLRNDVAAFHPSGAPVGGNFPLKSLGTGLCGVAVAEDGNFWLSFYNFFNPKPNGTLKEYSPSGEPTGRVIYAEATNQGSSTSMCDIELDSKGNLYNNTTFSTFSDPNHGGMAKFSPEGVKHRGSLDPGNLPGNITMTVDRSTDDLFIGDGQVRQYDGDSGFVGSIGQSTGSYPGVSNAYGVAVDETTHTLYSVAGLFPQRVDTFVRTEPITVPTVKTMKAEPVTPTSATLRGVINADGIDTTNCQFQWGTNPSVSSTVPCAEGHVFDAGSGDHVVSATISGLTDGREYHFRLTGKNANGIVSRGIMTAFRASSEPSLNNVTADLVDTGGARLNAEMEPNGSVTRYGFEWGAEPGNYTETVPVPSPPEGIIYAYDETQQLKEFLAGLQPESTYYFRLVAENDAGTTVSEEQSFTTYAKDPQEDPCPNAHVRQQTGTRLLFDCRAYELVSAEYAGGYDVESDLIPGQSPLVAEPRARDRVLYSLHYGSLPGIDVSPTNFGHDPYLANRGDSGWKTEYVGLPADGMTDQTPFGSPLLGTDAALSTFAFGGPDICDPCFPDGSTNIPLRLANGSLVEGMAGSLNPSAPRDPAGEVRKPLSEDGSHLVFGSTKQFEEDGSDGALTIYDRNLHTGTTQVASTMPNGSTMSGDVAELDVSLDGSRILIGKRVGEDAAGNDRYDLYMHTGSSANSVLVADTVNGVVFNGMTDDGTKVFFTTPDQLDDDADSSVDLFRADVGAGAATVTRVSTGSAGTGNTDACEPPGDPDSWNAPSGAGKCNVVAFAGGAGVAAGNGTVYFVSPEMLDGTSGEDDQANLYVAEPGSSPEFVATIDSSLFKPGPPPPQHPVEKINFGEGFSSPDGIAVDQSSGDVYIAELGDAQVHRFDDQGEPKDFTAGSDAGTNTLTGFSWLAPGTAQIAIDNSGGSSSGNLYVTSAEGFGESQVDVFSASGEHLQTLTGTSTSSPFGVFALACGVAVDQSNGDIYVGDYFGFVWRYSPTTSTVAETDYSGGIATGGSGSCGLAVASGNVYVRNLENNSARSYSTSAFASGPPPAPASTLIANNAKAVATDPASGDVYVDQSSNVSVFSSTGVLLESFGSGSLSNSAGVAVRSSNLHVFASSNGSRVSEFGYYEPPYSPIDHPAIVHGLHDAALHKFEDFQVTPGGESAAFSSILPLTGYPIGGHVQLYRYETTGKAIACVSCPPSGVTATSDTTLPPYGLALTDDGRVFFTTEEQLVLRDTNGEKDAYEWKNDGQQLISSGLGRQGAGLLSVSSDGKDAFFFTHEVHTATDQNGNTVKLYDARAGGGFPSLPPPVPCKAADECRGPGTQAAPPPNINTATGSGRTPGGAQGVKKRRKCRKRLVKRRGKCVRRQRSRSHRRRAGKTPSPGHG